VQIRKDKAVALDDWTDANAHWIAEHRPIPRKRVELAVLAARIDSRWKIGEQLFIERAARERAIQVFRIDAGQVRAYSAVDHPSGKVRCSLGFPQREERRQAGARKTRFTVAANILEKQIAEGDVGEPVAHEAIDRRFHCRFVLRIRTGPREVDHMQGQAGSVGLRVQQRASHGVHRHAIECLVHGCQQTRDGAGMLLLQHV
jgi:hypothetical protein